MLKRDSRNTSKHLLIADNKMIVLDQSKVANLVSDINKENKFSKVRTNAYPSSNMKTG